MKIIPAMDLMDGYCVRLKKGDFTQRTNYSPDPIFIAKKIELAGFRRLHMVDLDGAKSGSPKHISVLNEIAKNTELKIDFSGGIKNDNNIEEVFSNGAHFAAIGSVAVKNQALFLSWIKKFGSERIILGVDVRDEKLAISGWKEQTEISVFNFIKIMLEKGVVQFFCTDISKDGVMSGPSIYLYKKILSQFPEINLIASGGVRNPDDLIDLNDIGCAGAIVGKAIYEDFDNLKKWNIKF